jgi:hypothetical protein
MKRLGIVLIIAAFGLVFSVFTANAEMAKEGSGDIRGSKSGTLQFLKMGDDHNQMNYEESGVILDAPEDSPFYHATWYGIGTLHGFQGKFQATGAMVFTCTNGDQIFALVGTEGMLGKGNTGGGVKIVGGTGGCSGIEGELVATPRPPTKSSKQGTYQQIVLGKVNWKIP